MATWTPDPSFYPSPRMAMKAAPETLAYVAAFDPERKSPDAIAVVDVDPNSKSYSQIIGTTAMPNAGDELHHFGWNACSSCLCPNAPHAHAERRYLVVPGLRSSRIHILDTKPDPRNPKIVKVIEPQEVAEQGRLHPASYGPLRPGGHLRRRPRQPLRARGRAACFSWTTKPSTCAASGRWIAVRSTSPMTPGGISATIRSSPANGARPTPSRTG